MHNDESGSGRIDPFQRNNPRLIELNTASLFMRIEALSNSCLLIVDEMTKVCVGLHEIFDF